MRAIRSYLFYFLYYGVTVIVGTLGMLLIWLPFKPRAQLMLMMNRLSCWLLKICCNVKYDITGQENIPEGPCVVMANHQSAWETIYLQLHFWPISTVLKRELFKIPFFGWGIRLMWPIAIDRGNPRAALKQITQEGKLRVEAGHKLLIFPEGTRCPVGELGNFNRGGANLAVDNNIPVVAVAHNGGEIWPPKTVMKNSGTIKMVISPPFSPEGTNAKQLTKDVQAWVEQQISDS